FAIAWMNPQGISTRPTMSPQSNRENLRPEFDGNSRRFIGTAIKEGAKGHVYRSGIQEVAGILPYLPPRKAVRAKTNHLPNIQGQRGEIALYPVGNGV
ncbi:MAG: hypothetical protein J0H75_09530, partial [Rhizobiales bacterium]|nr:hypothetical protein [Hyphomicrobiales bacterium]